MTLQQSRRLQSLLLGTLAWAIAILIFFPIFWMVLTSFKTEIDAFATPPQFIFTPTLENYLHINERSNYFSYAWNSVLISFSATALCLLIAVPAAYSMAFYETQRTKGTLLWMLSTKMLPPVGVLMPIYLLAKSFGLLDTRIALIIIYTLINLPIVVWMVYTYFKDIPKDILEAARLDGATLWQEMVRVLLPIAKGGPGVHGAAVADPVLERGVLVAEPDLIDCRAADRADRLLLQPRRFVLGQIVGRLDPGLCADPDFWLDQPETAGARLVLRRREITTSLKKRIQKRRPIHGQPENQESAKRLRRLSRSSRASTWK